MHATPTGESPVIGIVAGEASGDLLAAHLVDALKSRRPDLEFVGIAGPRMIAAGVRALFPADKLAVRGYVEVLRHYLEITSIRRQIAKYFMARPPAMFIGVDAPDFNLDLELRLKSAGIRAVHYVSPSIWAWRGERIHKIKRAVDHMLALFPFEEEIYRKANIPVSYVGHPLADMLHNYPPRAQVRASLGLKADACIVALLPGSRISELDQLAAVFIAAAKKIAAAEPSVQFVAPLVNEQTRKLFARAMTQAGNTAITLLEEKSHDAIAAADVVLCASGTATLETALLRRPMVIAYKMPRVSWWMMNRMKYLPYAGLPNIIAGEFVVPEILQDDATPENLARAVLDLLHDEPRRQRIVERFDEMLSVLRQNTAQKAAEALMPYLGEKSG